MHDIFTIVVLYPMHVTCNIGILLSMCLKMDRGNQFNGNSGFEYSPERSNASQNRAIQGHRPPKKTTRDRDDLLSQILGDVWTPSQSSQHHAGCETGSFYSSTQESNQNDADIEGREQHLEQLLQQVENGSSQTSILSSQQHQPNKRQRRINYGSQHRLQEPELGTYQQSQPIRHSQYTIDSTASQNSREASAVQRQSHASATRMRTPQQPAQRRQEPTTSIPGPAGRLTESRQASNRPRRQPNRNSSETSPHGDSAVIVSGATQKMSYHEDTQESLRDQYERMGFFSNAWKAMARHYDRPGPTTTSDMRESLPQPDRPLCYFTQRADGNIVHIPFLTVIILTLTKYDDDTVAKVADPTDTIIASTPRYVVEEFSPDFRTGAVVVLKRPSIFSPTPGVKYLNIVAKNIVKVYAPETN